MPRLLTAIYCPAIFACVPKIQADEEPPAPKPESKVIGNAPKPDLLKTDQFSEDRKSRGIHETRQYGV